MSLLATPTFTGAGDDTFYIKTGGAAGGGVATIVGLSGTVGITGSGITVGTSGQNITLTASGGGVASIGSPNGTILVSGTTSVNLAVDPTLSLTSLTTSGAVNATTFNLGETATSQFQSAINSNVPTPSNENHLVGVPIAYPAIVSIGVSATQANGTAGGYTYRQFLILQDGLGLWGYRSLQNQTNGIIINTEAGTSPSTGGAQFNFYNSTGAIGTVCAVSWNVQRLGLPA